MLNQSQDILRTLHKSFFVCVSNIFLIFLEIIVYMPSMLLFYSISNVIMAIQKFTNFDYFLKFTLI